jgi:hypothetical protein
LDVLFYVFAGATGITAALTSIAIWAPRPTRVRVAALVIAMFFIPVVYVQSIEMLSKPKPMSFEWYERNEAKAVLIGITLDEGKAIYLWLQLPGSPEPRNYEVPWNLRLAVKLEDAVDDAVRRNSTIVLNNPFIKRSFEEWGDLNVEIIPPALAQMKKPTLPPRLYNPRDRSI